MQGLFEFCEDEFIQGRESGTAASANLFPDERNQISANRERRGGSRRRRIEKMQLPRNLTDREIHEQ
jgi:hypothetical protein